MKAIHHSWHCNTLLKHCLWLWYYSSDGWLFLPQQASSVRLWVTRWILIVIYTKLKMYCKLQLFFIHLFHITWKTGGGLYQLLTRVNGPWWDLNLHPSACELPSLPLCCRCQHITDTFAHHTVNFTPKNLWVHMQYEYNFSRLIHSHFILNTVKYTLSALIDVHFQLMDDFDILSAKNVIYI